MHARLLMKGPRTPVIAASASGHHCFLLQAVCQLAKRRDDGQTTGKKTAHGEAHFAAAKSERVLSETAFACKVMASLKKRGAASEVTTADGDR